ncbi:hypothetical protein SAMN05421858_4768 [Haladaptatus litoreus]|uniref:Uncharacterized protein n=1 Tax=Haladaptatus litoreus TaxID=553468 RepID=A0A1N7F3I4_9EURY|nr:hypothetical protein SAMN05421858_4768 [Haladaptatus litoreus]
MCIKKRSLIPINRCFFKIELNVAWAQIRVICILMKSNHEVAWWFYPVDSIILMVDADWIPKAKFQPCVLNFIGFTKEHRCVNICDYVPRTTTRWLISDGFAASLF